MKQYPAPLGQLAGRRICILGLGREGVSTYTFLRRHLPYTHLTLADRAPLDTLNAATREIIANDSAVTIASGPDYLAHLDQCDVLIKAPGITPRLPELVAARERGTIITSNTRLFFELCPGTIVGVTGTKGKSTTTSVIHAVLAAHSGDVRLLGNIGIPPLEQLDGTTSDTTFVVELSSHQLFDLEHSPHIAVLQNIVPEHLDYYESFAEYAAAKANITRYQSERDIFVYNDNYPLPREIASTTRARTLPFGFESRQRSGCFVEDGWIVYRSESHTERVISVDDVPLPGRFNLQNVMPAVAIGRLRGVPAATIAAAIRAFRGLEHRLEFVATIDGVRYYNDSLATVPEAAIAALDAFAEQPVVLIAGGYDRHVDNAPLVAALRNCPPRALVLFPPTGDQLLDSLAAAGVALPPHARVETMAEAVAQARRFAQRGDVVLLSPASASFVRFIDYRDRGNQFKAAVASYHNDA